MPLKKIALVLAIPLILGVGWGLRSAFGPNASPDSTLDGDEATPSVETEAAGEAPEELASGPEGEREARPTKGKGEKNGRQAGGGNGKVKKGDGPTGKIPSVPLTMNFTDGEGGPPVTDARVFLSVTNEKMRQRVKTWATSSGADAIQKAAFGDEGLSLDENGSVQVDVPLEMGLRVDVRGPALGEETRVVVIRPLREGMKRPRDIDIQKTQVARSEDAPRSGGAAPTAEQSDGPLIAASDAPKEFFYVKVTAPDGLPVPEASVRFEREEVARTDEDGRFSLAFDPTLSPVMRIVTPGFAPAIVQATLGHHYPERARTVVLLPGAAIQARILTADGLAARGTQVVLRTDMSYVLGESEDASGELRGARLGELRWDATVNKLGMVFFESLPTGAPLSIEVHRLGGREEGGPGSLAGIPPSVVLAPGEEWKPEWRLPGRPELAGRVVDQDGDPIVGASVWLVALGEGDPAIARYLRPDDEPLFTQRTDDQGRFRFVDIDEVPWLVGLKPERPEDRAAWQMALGSLALPAMTGDVHSPSQAELLIVASRGLTIRGVVLGPNGLPVPGALVTALEERGHGALEVRAKGDGEFVIGPLSAGHFALLVSGCDDCGVERFGPFQAGSREIVLRQSPVERFTGSIVGPGGDPRAGRLSVFSDGVLRAQIDTASGLQPGRFEVALQPGLYDFVATTSDGQVGALRAMSIGPETPNSGITLPVERGAEVKVRYLGEHPWRHVTFFHDGRLFASGIVRAGVPRGQFVPAGRILVRLQAELGERPLEREFEISVGTRNDVVFEGDDELPIFGEPEPVKSEGEGESETVGASSPSADAAPSGS